MCQSSIEKSTETTYAQSRFQTVHHPPTENNTRATTCSLRARRSSVHYLGSPAFNTSAFTFNNSAFFFNAT